MEQELPLKTIQTEDQQHALTGVVIFLGIIAFFAVGLGGVMLGKYLYASRTPSATPGVTPTPRVAAPTTTPTSDTTPEWKTYTNQKLMFSIDIPSDMKIAKEDTGWIEWQGNLKEINIIIQDNPKTGKPYGKLEPVDENNIYLECGLGETPQKTDIFGQIAIRCPDGRFLNGDNYPEDNATSIDYHILDTRNSIPRSIRLWGITLKDSVVNPREIDQILSTFRFTD